jgi:hypothetical protein
MELEQSGRRPALSRTATFGTKQNVKKSKLERSESLKREHSGDARREAVVFSLVAAVFQLFLFLLYALWIDYAGSPVRPLSLRVPHAILGGRRHCGQVLQLLPRCLRHDFLRLRLPDDLPSPRWVCRPSFLCASGLNPCLNRYSAIGWSLMVGALVVQWSVPINILVLQTGVRCFCGQECSPPLQSLTVWPGRQHFDMEHMLNGLFCAAAGTLPPRAFSSRLLTLIPLVVLISYGGVLGKISPLQLLVMAIIEPMFYW